jgi:hypothetical protein
MLVAGQMLAYRLQRGEQPSPGTPAGSSRLAAPRAESEQLWFAIDDRSTLAT